MQGISVRAFSEEVASIYGFEKDALSFGDVKNVAQTGVKAVKGGLGKANNLAWRGAVKLHSHPLGQKVVNYLNNPNTAESLARSLAGG